MLVDPARPGTHGLLIDSVIGVRERTSAGPGLQSPGRREGQGIPDNLHRRHRLALVHRAAELGQRCAPRPIELGEGGRQPALALARGWCGTCTRSQDPSRAVLVFDPFQGPEQRIERGVVGLVVAFARRFGLRHRRRESRADVVGLPGFGRSARCDDDPGSAAPAAALRRGFDRPAAGRPRVGGQRMRLGRAILRATCSARLRGHAGCPADQPCRSSQPSRPGAAAAPAARRGSARSGPGHGAGPQPHDASTRAPHPTGRPARAGCPGSKGRVLRDPVCRRRRRLPRLVREPRKRPATSIRPAPWPR